MVWSWDDASRETVLFEGRQVRVRAYRCRGTDFGPVRSCVSPWNSILFVRSGGFRKRVRGRDVTADPNWAVFFNDGEEYELDAPSPFDDRVTEVELRPDLLAEMLGGAASAGDPPTRPFARADCLVEPALFQSHVGLWRRAAAGADALAIEELALGVADAALRAMSDEPRGRCGPARTSSPATRRVHADLAHAATMWLAARYRERPSLDDVADAVEVSPFHLCRVFKACTGISVHRYLDRLRLREALVRLHDARADLTTLALELGYSSHSHFTTAFRREFGVTPSAARPARP